jgi:hypothetical protein
MRDLPPKIPRRRQKMSPILAFLAGANFGLK